MDSSIRSEKQLGQLETKGAQVAAALAVGMAATGCITAARRVAGRDLPAEPTVPENAEFERTVMNRLAFGPLPGDLTALRSRGFAKHLEEQLGADETEDAVLNFQLSRLDVLRVSAAELRDLPEGEVARQLRQATLLRMLYSKWQLRERMVDFWTNHFNIHAEKGDNAYRKPTDDLLVIRKHALGKFSDLVRASAKSAAMLGYLNNDVNKKGVPNENYARELMELHTMGVHGGYTQQDIKEVARCLTGWTVEDRKILRRLTDDGPSDAVGTGVDKFAFRSSDHDANPKIVLGRKISAEGSSEGDQVIDIVSHHPATADFICGKLCRYFLGDERHPAHAAAAKAFLSSDGDIKTVLRAILTEENLKTARPLAKRPIDFLASAIRSVGAESDGGKAIQVHLEKMGQPLFGWPMPDGYPDKTAAWTGSLLARWNFAWALANGHLGGTWYDADRVMGREEMLAHGKGAKRAMSTLGPGDDPASQKKEGVAILAAALSAPEFQWR